MENHQSLMRGLLILTLAMGGLGLGIWMPVAHGQDDNPFALLNQPGHVAFIRHTLAPGSDDPPGFQLEACDTQRNLNDTGREQARTLGQQIKDAGVTVDALYSSQWCRCLDTARLMEVGDVQPLPDLNSVYGRHRVHERERTANMRRFLAELDPETTAVMVTHYANIYALTRVAVSSGGGVVLRTSPDGQFEVVAEIPAP
ncbi:MAG: histidine phosphatase family protein [Candidatus Competibacterales bacterium]